jgi:protein ImuB
MLLEQVITSLAIDLAHDLHGSGWAVRSLGLTLVLEDGAPRMEQRTLPVATADRATIIQALLALSRSAIITSGVEAVRVAGLDLVPLAAAQLDLFAPERGQRDRLDAVLSQLSTRQANGLLRAILANPQARLPERRVRLDLIEGS